VGLAVVFSLYLEINPPPQLVEVLAQERAVEMEPQT
jgi:hypothetical protein